MSLSSIIHSYEQAVHRADDPMLLQNNSCVWIISGRRGAGKSSLLLSVLGSERAWKHRFDNIFFVSPTASLDRKFGDLVSELERDGKYSDSMSEAFIDSIFERVQYDNQRASEHPNPKHRTSRHLLVLDDVAVDLSKSNSALLNRMVIQSRHHKLSIVILTQKYMVIPPIIRANADLISYFPSLNSREIAGMQDDMNIDKRIFGQIYRVATSDPHSFLHANLLAFPPKFYKNFDPIQVDITPSLVV
jgi:hypothetical protein